MYNFRKIENKWQKIWQQKKSFETGKSSKKKFYMLEMFPYPSAYGLHMGHARNYTIGDVLARYKRMTGLNVLYSMGYDSFGLPAENAAIREGVHPLDYTKKAIKNYINQQRSLGLSYDWSRMVCTHKPDYYKWDQWIFLQFLKKDLAYRKKALVNFCPRCNTVLANEQVENGKCWRHHDTEVEIKDLEQWFLKITEYADKLYDSLDKLKWPETIKEMQRNWINPSEGTLIKFKVDDECIEVFTTRPDTLYGVTFITFAPEHPKVLELVKGTKYETDVKKFINKILLEDKSERTEKEKEGMFIGKYAIHPLTKEKIPIFIANFVLLEYGTGVVMGVPAHDKRDYEFAKKYDLKMITVIAQNKPTRSYLMGASAITNEDLEKIGIKIVRRKDDGDREIEIPKQSVKKYEKMITDKLTPNFWNEYIGEEIVFIFKHKDGKIERLVLNKDTEERIDKLAADFIGENWNKKCVWKWLSENKFYSDLVTHEEEGILVNSEDFNGLTNKKAIIEITSRLNSYNLGNKTIQYHLRDWLISRQRYWGCPIPIIYCDKCGIVPVPEKDLPVKLPKKVDFKSGGNPLATNKEFTNVKCPKCRGNARRETDTMDTFVDSSWYFLRYTDNKNTKEIFSPEKANYWLPIDQYIGGREHATGHLIYFRFFTKFFKDIKLINFDEPALRLFTQGDVNKNGVRMSKSKGNVVDPMDMINEHGSDSLRFYLMFVSSPDSVFEWDDGGIISVSNFLNKLYDLSKAKCGGREKDGIVLSKINSLIGSVTENIENFKYNRALIGIMEFTNYLHKNKDYVSQKVFNESYKALLTLSHPFVPHLTSELNCDSKWPSPNRKLINNEIEFEEEFLSSTMNDIHKIIKLIKKKPNRIKLSVSELWKYDFYKRLKSEASKEFKVLIEKLMTKEHGKEIPRIVQNYIKNPGKVPLVILSQMKELEILNSNKKMLEKEFGCEIEMGKNDSKANPGKVSILIE